MNQNGSTLRPYTKGWRAPWKGHWGPLADGHSRLGRLRLKIEKQFVEKYQPVTDEEWDSIRDAAEMRALANQCAKQIGVDPKATPRKLSALRKTAKALLAPLLVREANNVKPDLAKRLAAMQQQASR